MNKGKVLKTGMEYKVVFPYGIKIPISMQALKFMCN